MSTVRLSVVIPAFNASGWIGKCLGHLDKAIHEAGLTDVEIVVVDDGSTDSTVQEISQLKNPGIRVISQQNLGRFRARFNGLRVCGGTHVLFLDTRVLINKDSLKFVLPYLSQTETSLWTAHVEINTTRNHLARFWRAIEMFFWRRYFQHPRTMSFDLVDFDYYPKGTTALIAPIDLIRDAFSDFEPTVSDWHLVNDDTAVLRYAAAHASINISPHYSCVYNARTDLKKFLKHARHRGSVLIDGYLRRGTRLAMPIAAVLGTAPLAIVLPIISWKISVVLLFLLPLLIVLGMITRGISLRDAQVIYLYFWPFSVAYLIGMYRGVSVRLRPSKLRQEIH